MEPDKKYLEKQSSQTGFARDNLEKVWRLTVILKRIFETTNLKDNFLLRGGTALNFIHSNIPRLSVDVDLDFIGTLDKNIMKTQQPGLLEAFNELGLALGYKVIPHNRGYAADLFILKYNSLWGLNTSIKIDLNWVNRKPLQGLNPLIFNSAFPEIIPNFKVPTLSTEELLASKIVTFLARKQPRDFYDAYQIAYGTYTCNKHLLKKLVIWSGCTEERDFRKISKSPNITISEREFEQEVFPLLRRTKTKPEFSKAKEITGKFIQGILAFNNKEEDFISRFYKKEIRPDLLFEKHPYPSDIMKHPNLLWRLENM